MDTSKMNFLVVDDDHAILEIVGAALTTFGVQRVVKCPSGAAAINELADPNNKFHCVISDYSMHPISGLDLLKGIRMGQYGEIPRELPFVMVTVSAKEHVVKAALALDVSAYVMKPITQQALGKAINRATSRLFAARPPDIYEAVKYATD